MVLLRMDRVWCGFQYTTLTVNNTVANPVMQEAKIVLIVALTSFLVAFI